MLRGRTPRTRFRPRSRPFQEHTLRTGSRRLRCSPWCGTCARVEESAIARAVGFSCPRSYLPTPQDVHGRQDDFPPAGWYVDPTSHCSQLLAPPTLNSPGRQVPHSWMAMFANSPGPQYSQAFLVSETALLTQPYVSSQLVHSIAPGLLYLRAKRVQRKSQAGDRATSRCGTGGSGGLPPSTFPAADGRAELRAAETSLRERNRPVAVQEVRGVSPRQPVLSCRSWACFFALASLTLTFRPRKVGSPSSRCSRSSRPSTWCR
jgi:hypothetical protein